MKYLWFSIAAIVTCFFEASCHNSLVYQQEQEQRSSLRARRLGAVDAVDAVGAVAVADADSVADSGVNIYPFQNVSLDWKTRVDDLVSRLTVDEVILQLSHGGAGSGPAPAIARLGIERVQWNNECLRGYVWSGAATSFPHSINLAATFDKSVVARVAEAGASEARARHADYVKQGNYDDHTGLSCFSPVINILAHPLWGRAQETYGEDPSLTAQLAESFVHGLMGNDSRYIRANSVCKHFAAYNGPEDKPSLRNSFNAVVPEVDLRMTFLPQFEACVKAGAQGVMCSLNSLNGAPTCANKWLLQKVLRDEWNFDGFVVSDEGAIEQTMTDHHYYNTTLQVAVGTVTTGVNLELPGGMLIFSELTEAVQKGLIDKALLYERVWPLFYTRMRLGEFDPDEMNPFTKYNLSLIQSAAQKNLSLSAAKKSFVLLKHTGNTLPIKRKVATLTLIGPFANTTDQFFGFYSPTPDINNTVLVVDGMRMLVKDAGSLTMVPGCADPTCRNYDNTQRGLVLAAAKRERNLIVLALGTGQINEQEGNDRATFSLPGGQSTMLSDVLNVAEASGVPVVLVVFSASSIDITRAVESKAVVDVFQCGIPAQEAGLALYHVLALVDDESNPAGRLPYTWYRDASQLPAMTDYDMRNKTYRFLGAGTEPLFEFGFGLSYSEFKYAFADRSLLESKAMIVVADGTGEDDRVVNVSVNNMGPYNGDTVVEIYVRWPDEVYSDASFERVPTLQLLAFERVSLKARETRVISVEVDTKWLRLWSKGTYVTPSGSYSLFVGGGQPKKGEMSERSEATVRVRVRVEAVEARENVRFVDIEDALGEALFGDKL